MKHNPVFRPGQKFSPTVFGFENAGFAFTPQLGLSQIRFGSDKTHQAFGLMDFEEDP